MNNLQTVKEQLIFDINKRLEDKIIEPTNAELLKKLITNADSTNEAMMIAELGTTYKRTGFHFDKRLEKMGTDIKFLKKNTLLSFVSSKNEETDNAHKLIIGDNYDALQQLLITHKGMIDVIYIDPPYGSDSMGQFANMNYANSITRDNLLSMLYPRLILAKQLLSEDGVIFCSIDDKNYAYLKCMFDDVFAERNVETFIWNTEAEGKSGSLKQTKRFRNMHEYVIIGYADKSCTNFAKINEAVEGVTALQTTNLAKNNKNKKGDKNRIFDVVNKTNGMVWTDEWKYDKAKIDELLANNLIWFGKDGTNKPREILPMDDRRCVFLTSILNYGSSTQGRKDFESVMVNEALFQNPKPLKLIKTLLKTCYDKNCIVLDFFAGSGTTGQAVLELNQEDSGNRHFILCTNNEITNTTPNGIAYDVTSKRLKRVMTGECYDGFSDFEWIKKNEALGGSLDVFEIETVNNAEQSNGKSPFDVIDESCYGLKKFTSPSEKIAWICSNFENTQKYLKEE